MSSSLSQLAATGLPHDWATVLAASLSHPNFEHLQEFVTQERQVHTVYPPAEKVFTALQLTPFEQAKVLILGQDPYHGAGQAHGLAFSVQRGQKIPPSLRNIYKELEADIGITPPKHGNLEAWAAQGVVLLNAVLTVREGQPNSHADHGWESLTDDIIRALNAKEERVVFVLWGAYARKKRKLITEPQHTILESGHPSPLSVRYFAGSRPFSAINQALQEAGQVPIDWSLPE